MNAMKVLFIDALTNFNVLTLIVECYIQYYNQLMLMLILSVSINNCMGGAKGNLAVKVQNFKLHVLM